jgi:hypothetical protein
VSSNGGMKGIDAAVFFSFGGGVVVGKKNREGRGWAERPDGPKVTGKILFRIKFDFLYTEALEICTRRFRRNFDMRIFPKFF